ncbi:MAG: hypothetical protein R3E82_08370 [Pseudomonadales bacterium]|nr:hypothetical protein [Pseudomonadales bacterium]
MQFTRQFKEAIREGKVTCSFRTWRSPQAKVGGRYNLHPTGAIEVTALKQLRLADARLRDIRRSGFPDREALCGYLKVGEGDDVYQVEFRYLGTIRVKAPPRHKPGAQESQELIEKLEAMDARSSRGPWACRTLALIGEHPGLRAAELAAHINWETRPFKASVRRLKQLGLTESLETGYRLTKRGRTVLEHL